MCKMTLYQCLFVLVILLKDVFALKDVVLTIRPEVVERGSFATLICSYDLEGATLYYVKWYRGMHEFYRYTPSERPTTKIFPIDTINVDVYRSNATQAVLTDIDFKLSGNFSCEVTTDEEPASTETAVQSMLVVQLPEFFPTISVGRDPLDYGDVLRANCTSPPARPAAKLKFFLNDLLVASTPPLSPRRSQEVLWSDLNLELPLHEYHFMQGKLVLRCVAQVAGIYHEEAVLVLPSLRDPVPAKVSADDSARLAPGELILQVLFVLIAGVLY
ncbi:uncharacterized protein LOC659208 [Tribolium castaneum]|uniref:Ig-like domain-containing protein n=1 Tax=Tribolium castaneum TaxID=7070 RepID=A0A139WKS0_TRICA|nr:PREDICTED: uncharacterized protein LOC659208 [Tribolium castaneum]KYB28506.1 hypothetical protein TcasGA2_TC031707 [Tribolium castaneum]|eukprot:XP_970628.2 PREDICTED: uncharacterized protein LOC659208 [Tribolium castaneum]